LDWQSSNKPLTEKKIGLYSEKWENKFPFNMYSKVTEKLDVLTTFFSLHILASDMRSLCGTNCKITLID